MPVQNQQQNTEKDLEYSNHYHTEIKQFAMTLHYYSPKGYEFIQHILKLPHSSSIRTWAANVDCQPRYLTSVIEHIGQVARTKHLMKEVVFVIDAMFCTKLQFGDHKHKYCIVTIDYGTASPKATDKPAA